MTTRRRRRPGSDRLHVFSPEGLPLGHLDLPTGTTHDVPTSYAAFFRSEVDAWLTAHGRPRLEDPSAPGPAGALEAATTAPIEGWAAWEPDADTYAFGDADTRAFREGDTRAFRGGDTGAFRGGDTGAFREDGTGAFRSGDTGTWTGALPASGSEDLATHLPGHGLAAEASRARATGEPDADRPHRLRIDGRHAVADALVKLAGRGPGLRRPRWRMLHGIPMATEDGPVLLDHLVVGPGGIFVLEVANHPGKKIVMGPRSLEIDRERIDVDRRRAIGEEVEDRIAEGLAIAAGAERTLNPPTVTPVVAVVGAVLVGRERPPGVLVARVGQLPRLLQAFGNPLTDLAVQQIFGVARQAETWTR